MTQCLDDALHTFHPPLPFAVAFSGGADSTALLVACAERWPNAVRAIHVNHGLQSAAPAFELHCRQLCAQFGVPLDVAGVEARHLPGDSPEDAARRARYGALETVVRDVGLRDIALAQHADDQVETILLALSRGTGMRGLAAMPTIRTRNGISYHRPLLRVAGRDVRAWLARRGVAWIEDPTNLDTRFTRNRIRAELLPMLQQAWPAFRDTFARTADHAAQAIEILADMAALDLALVGTQPSIRLLRTLSHARQANVLRHWLLTVHSTTPSAAQLNELLRQIESCSTRGHDIRLRVGAGLVYREGPILGWQKP